MHARVALRFKDGEPCDPVCTSLVDDIHAGAVNLRGVEFVLDGNSAGCNKGKKWEPWKSVWIVDDDLSPDDALWVGHERYAINIDVAANATLQGWHVQTKRTSPFEKTSSDEPRASATSVHTSSLSRRHAGLRPNARANRPLAQPFAAKIARSSRPATPISFTAHLPSAKCRPSLSRPRPPMPA